MTTLIVTLLLRFKMIKKCPSLLPNLMDIFLKEEKLLYRGRIQEKGHQKTGVFRKEVYPKMMESVSNVIKLAILRDFAPNSKNNKNLQFTEDTRIVLVKNHVRER